MNTISKERADQVFGGIFLIGLAILFFTGYWWPGIMFAVGIAMLARTYAEGKPVTSNMGALITLAIGLIFAFGDVFDIFGSVNWWPILLIGLGLYMLFGHRLRREDNSTSQQDAGGKAKNDLL